MSLYIEIVSAYTYTYPKHFLPVMIFVGLWIFTSGLAHVCVRGSASQLKRRTFLHIFSFSA